MSPVRFSVQQVVLMNLLFIILVVTGVLVLRRLPVEVYPDVSLDIATITTPWLGASSEEIERLVTRRIEEEIEDARGVDRIVSVSQPDVSVITVKFREDVSEAQYEAAFDDLRTRMERVTDLPDDAKRPILERVSTDELMPLVQVAVINVGDVEEMVLRRVALDLKDELRSIPGVTQVREVGMREPELHILLDKTRLEQHDLSLAQVADVLRANNLNLPAGYLPDGDSEITLRGRGEVTHPRDFGDIAIVRSPTGAHLLLRDVAEIRETFERAVWTARIDGWPAILLYIVKDSAANSLTVRDEVEEYITAYQSKLGFEGVRLELQADTSSVISSRLNVLKNNLLVGLVLVFFILWKAIGVRNSLLAIVGIPFSFLCAVIFMHLIGVSLNAVSVFALVLVSGMIVDDAIVVLENIYHHIQTGMPVKEAVIVGAEEVLWPVISSTMTTIAAFLPLLMMTGVLGEFFSIVPKTVTVALAASLFECLIILPVHYLDWGPRPPRAAAKGAPPDGPSAAVAIDGPGLLNRSLRLYDKVLGQALAYRYAAPVLLAGCVLFAWQAQRAMTIEMFPSDFPTFVVDFYGKPGLSLDAMAREVDRFTPVVDSFKPDRVERCSAAIGVQFNEDNQRIMRTDIAQMWVDVTAETNKASDPAKIIHDVRTALNEFLDAHPESGIESIRAWPIRDGPPVGKPVAIRIEHPDYDYARLIADQMRTRLEGMAGVRDISDNLQLGNRELILTVDDDRAAEQGLAFLDVATALRGARDGLLVGVYKDTLHDEDVDVKVRYAEQYVQRPDQLLDTDVVSARTGQVVKLHQVGNLHFDQTYTNRFHYDGKRAIIVTADVDTDITDAKIVNRALMAEFAPLAEGNDRLSIQPGGQFAETQASFASLIDSGAVALLLMYLILASQFRNYLQPLVVLTTVVFGALGMVLGLVLNGYPFSVVTGIAMVGLSGVVVNDAIVLLDFINKQRAAGLPLSQAIHVACQRRLRPILLTTVTTVAGLAPMALGVGGYSKIWSPFAMSMCWGLCCATLLTLVVVPALYHIVEDVRGGAASLLARLRGRSHDMQPASHTS